MLEPYPGYGCPQTLFANLIDTLTVSSNAGPDAFSCNNSLVPIGSIGRPGLSYTWSPTIGLSDAYSPNPTASPDVSTSYILRTNSRGGGCISFDTVVVSASRVDTSLQISGKTAFCIGYGDSAVLRVQPTTNIQWFANNNPINGATQANFRVTGAGSYSARLTDQFGCSAFTRKENIIVEKQKPGIRYPLQYAIIDLPITLNARKIGVSALWSPAVNLNAALTFSPVFRGPREQQYTIEIKTIAGCITIDTQLVKTVKKVEIFMPTAFTPNSDGKNDYLKPTLIGVKDMKYFRIFNRWGQMMFQTTEEDKPGWDGRFNGMHQTSQTVVWELECIGLDGLTYKKKGVCILIR